LTLPIYSLAISPDAHTLLATTWGEGAGHGLYLSTNSGATWTQDPFFSGRVLAGCAVSSTGALFAAPSSPLPAYSNPGLWRSTDGGNSWVKLTGFDQVGYSLNDFNTFARNQLLFNSDDVL